LYPELFAVLLRFREKPLAPTGDIKKAFLQIEIAEEDRDAVRLLLLKEPQDDVTVPRRYSHWPDQVNYELHIFCDASQLAFGAAAYLRMRQNSQNTSLVTGKTRVAPVKAVTLPRLELLAAMTASSLVASLRRKFTLPLARRVIWSDSTVVLGWVRSDPHRWKQFVRNRCHHSDDQRQHGANMVASLSRQGHPRELSQ